MAKKRPNYNNVSKAELYDALSIAVSMLYIMRHGTLRDEAFKERIAKIEGVISRLVEDVISEPQEG